MTGWPACWRGGAARHRPRPGAAHPGDPDPPPRIMGRPDRRANGPANRTPVSSVHVVPNHASCSRFVTHCTQSARSVPNLGAAAGFVAIGRSSDGPNRPGTRARMGGRVPLPRRFPAPAGGGRASAAGGHMSHSECVRPGRVRAKRYGVARSPQAIIAAAPHPARLLPGAPFPAGDDGGRSVPSVDGTVAPTTHNASHRLTHLCAARRPPRGCAARRGAASGRRSAPRGAAPRAWAGRPGREPGAARHASAHHVSPPRAPAASPPTSGCR
jgi:hypothetical protein